VDAKEVAARLAGTAESVAQYLYPEGKKEAHNWTFGHLDGRAGHGVSVCLSGAKAGRWKDYQWTGESGDLIDLWGTAHQLSVGESIRAAKKWLGIDEPTFSGTKKKAYQKPKRPGKIKPADKTNAAGRYLAGERGLGWDVLRQWGVGYLPLVSRLDPNSGKMREIKGPWILFPYFVLDGGKRVLTNIKYLHVERRKDPKSGKLRRFTFQEKNAEPTLFGWHTIPPDARSVTITEGEIDAITVSQWGWPALSVPAGAGTGDKLQWIEHDWERLERFDEIFICMDADEAGRSSVPELMKRLGTHRCRVVNLPHKDANECLVPHAMGPDQAKPFWDRAEYLMPDELRSASSFTDQVIKAFYPTDDAELGLRLRWSMMSEIRLRRGEVTLVTGINGHGKALDINTLLPTPSGWTTMGKVNRGDELFDENGNVCRVVLGTEVMSDHKCYRVRFSDGTEIIADADHRWLTWDRNTHKAFHYQCGQAGLNSHQYPCDWATWSSGVMSRLKYCPGERTRMRELRAAGMTSADVGVELGRTADAIQQQWNLDEPSVVVGAKIVTTAKIAETLKRYGEANHTIPAVKPLKFPSINLPIPPYVLGYLLGDGDTSGNGRVACHPEDREWIMSEFRLEGVHARPHGDAGHFRVFGLGSTWRGIGLHDGKFIPRIYLRSSIEQRIALVQGMIDSDGTVDNHGAYRFTNTNRALIDGFRELVISLGLVARTGERHGRKRAGSICKTSWDIIVPSSLQLARLERKASKARHEWKREQYSRRIVACDPVPSVPVRCIEVDSASKLFLASEAMIPTHNSTWLNQLVAYACDDGERACIASMEMQPRDTIAIMVRQIAGTERPKVEYIKKATSWMDGRLWIYNVVGKTDRNRLIEVMTYARRRFGVRLFVIDSLMRCGIAVDDYEGQGNFVDSLLVFARAEESHVLLVVHPAKPKDESRPVGRLAIKGAGTMTDLAHNTIEVWRNKPKESRIEATDQKFPLDSAEHEQQMFKERAQPDTKVVVDKQRNGTGWIGTISMWFERDSRAWRDDRMGRRPEFKTLQHTDDENSILL